ncbi:MAG: hypothetical protein U0M66_04595 [Bacilli bacterium]|nr:hypothetical protein [Bacilli bacterium]
MKIITWYNPTLDKYKTEYRQFVLDYEVGYIDNRGHILISTVYFFDDKIFHDREALDRYIDKKIYGAKNRAKNKFLNFVKKL